MSYVAAEKRYEHMPYKRVGRSGLKLPLISLGLWYNFGGLDVFENSRTIARRAFDLGITHSTWPTITDHHPAPPRRPSACC
jgi:L-glyceraldehyde 3-phosphate reductase